MARASEHGLRGVRISKSLGTTATTASRASPARAPDPTSRIRVKAPQTSPLLARIRPTASKTLKNTWNTGRTKVRINTVGFFYESPDVGAFLWALARENDGSFVGMSKP